MPSKRKKGEGAASGSGVSIPAELLDRLVQGPMTPEEVQAICLDFKKAVIERAMGRGAEPSPGLPPRRGAPRGPGQPAQRHHGEDGADGPGLHRWHPGMLDLAEQCGFQLRLCRPYRARTKGQVERFNGYLKGSFLVPLKATLKAAGLKLDLDTANREVLRWLVEIADRRVHATTGIEPYHRLPEDQALLQPLPHGLKATPVIIDRRPRLALPIESLQHPQSVYEALLEVAA